MNARIQRVLLVVGVTLSVFGLLFAISGAVRSNYPVLIGSGITLIVGMMLIAYIWD